MTTLVPIPMSMSTSTCQSNDPSRRRVSCSSPNPPRPSWLCFNQRPKYGDLHRSSLRLWSAGSGIARVKHGLLMGDTLRGNNSKRVVLVRLNRGFGSNGGGGKDDGSNARILGNLALAIGLAYLSFTGQLGWILDTLFSIWLIAFLLPVLGLGAFLWWAGQEMIQSTCPNCDQEFQIFRSMINDELQLCPYCSQPFSVVNDKFVRGATTSSAGSFGSFSKNSTKGKKTSQAVVDVEAEIVDAD